MSESRQGGGGREEEAREHEAREEEEARGVEAPGVRAPLPLSARKPDPRGNSLSWVHTFRLSPLALILILATLGGLWYLLETTDLWYRLFP